MKLNRYKKVGVGESLSQYVEWCGDMHVLQLGGERACVISTGRKIILQLDQIIIKNETEGINR